MKSIDDLALKAAKRADSMGCCFCTQMGGQPSKDEAFSAIQELLSEAKKTNNNKFLFALIAHALLALFNDNYEDDSNH